jgi:predicted DNA-binding transcriptional regulator YafY
MTFYGIFDPMPRATDLARLQRLDLLEARLKAEAPMTVTLLAAEFGISPRSLFRDLALLRERGVPVEADRGRGGGLRLPRTWGTGRLALSYREAVELLVSLAIAERMRAPWALADLGAIRRKLAASFAPAMRERVEGLRARIRIGQAASAPVLGSLQTPGSETVGRLFEAFVEMRTIRLTYRSTGAETQRRVEPQMLMLNYPVWYLLAWDLDRAAVRTFRCDRMLAVAVTAEAFRLRPPRAFAAALEGTEAAAP